MSPVSLRVHQGDLVVVTVDIGFVANNPGIWMIRCHNFIHANWGMDMMLVYQGYSPSYTVGTLSKNFPD